MKRLSPKEEEIMRMFWSYGNTYQYHPVISESEYKGSALNEVVSQFYDNSYINVVSQLIEEERMPLDELKDLIARIEKGRK